MTKFNDQKKKSSSVAECTGHWIGNTGTCPHVYFDI